MIEGWRMRVEKLLHINVQRFRGGLVFKAHRLSYHSTLGSRVMKKKKMVGLAQPLQEVGYPLRC